MRNKKTNNTNYSRKNKSKCKLFKVKQKKIKKFQKMLAK